jgi:hypothetical protein
MVTIWKKDQPELMSIYKKKIKMYSFKWVPGSFMLARLPRITYQYIYDCLIGLYSPRDSFLSGFQTNILWTFPISPISPTTYSAHISWIPYYFTFGFISNKAAPKHAVFSPVNLLL